MKKIASVICCLLLMSATVSMGHRVDDAIESINRAAVDAVIQAKDIKPRSGGICYWKSH